MYCVDIHIPHVLFQMTRHQLLMLRANQRAGWVGYAIALHTLGEYENALNVLQTFRKTQEVTYGLLITLAFLVLTLIRQKSFFGILDQYCVYNVARRPSDHWNHSFLQKASAHVIAKVGNIPMGSFYLI